MWRTIRLGDLVKRFGSFCRPPLRLRYLVLFLVFLCNVITRRRRKFGISGRVFDRCSDQLSGRECFKFVIGRAAGGT